MLGQAPCQLTMPDTAVDCISDRLILSTINTGRKAKIKNQA
jgi:hypothetical protein